MTTKCAVIGCGRMGAFTNPITEKYAPNFYFPLSHCKAISSHQDASLIALCDNSSDALSKASEKFNVSKTYKSYKQLIDDNEIDLLSIATRTNIRSEIIQYAFKKGIKAFHAEKPLCNSLKQLNELEKLFKNDDFYKIKNLRKTFGN